MTTMTADDWDRHIRALADVGSSTNYGYRFYFVGNDDRLPFATIADNGNEHEKVSALHRPGVFRLNIGIRHETFEALGLAREPTGIDFTVLDQFLPHPDYAKQNFICILNPAGENIERTRHFLAEAHAMAVARRRT